MIIPLQHKELLKDPLILEGWEAYVHNFEFRDCPYGIDTDSEYGWKKGWTLAYKFDMLRNNSEITNEKTFRL